MTPSRAAWTVAWTAVLVGGTAAAVATALRPDLWPVAVAAWATTWVVGLAAWRSATPARADGGGVGAGAGAGVRAGGGVAGPTTGPGRPAAAPRTDGEGGTTNDVGARQLAELIGSVPGAAEALGLDHPGDLDHLDRSALAESMRHLALHDPLTGLPNRTLVLDRIEAGLARARRTGEPLAVLMVDLDHFKEVNDTLGHARGDELLVELAHRYTEDLRDCDTVGRIGGDEFVVVLTTGASVAGTRGVAERIARLTEEPVDLNGTEVAVGASVGASRHPDHGADARELLRRADSAMYRAKRTGATFAFFSSALERIELRHVELRSALLADEWVDELRTAYRPRTDLRSMRPVGVEASAVWEHPRHGAVRLVDLVEIGAPADHLSRLARAVTEQAVTELAGIGWPTGMTVNVDMSGLPWLDPAVADWLPALLAEHLLPPGAVCIQVTQSQVLASTGIDVAGMRALQAQGVRFALGGFGSLDSSLSALRELPLDEILVHRRLVGELAAGDPTIVRAVVDLTHRLGLVAVADGVDTPEVLDRIRMLDCDIAMGAMAGGMMDVDGLAAYAAGIGGNHR